MTTSSGTLHTIRFAKQQRKPIFIFMPTEEQRKLEQYEGIQYLIKKKDQYNLQIIDDYQSIRNNL